MAVSERFFQPNEKPKPYMISGTLPDHWMKRIHLDNARIFIQGVNLLTFSSFKIWDVELGDGRGARYPNLASVSLGVNFNF